MKHLFYTAISCGLLTTPSQGELLFEEIFDYPEGPLAGNTNSFANASWVAVSGSANSVIAASSLAYSAIENGGKSVNLTSSTRLAIDLSSIAAIDTPTEGSTLYISFLQQLGEASSTNSNILEFWNRSTANSDITFSYGTDTRIGTADLGLTLRKTNPRFITLPAPEAELNTNTNLVVIRVDYGMEDEVDNIRYYINPGASEPNSTTTVADNSGTNFNLTFDRIGFGSFQQGAMSVDAIRIATTYEEAVAAASDTDDDGIPDTYEMENGLDFMVNDAAIDNDSDGGPDGLTNLEEFQNRTNPQDSDSDDDGINDGDEVKGNQNPYTSADPLTPATSPPGVPTNPNNEDSDGDGILDLEEITMGNDTYVTNPNQADTDGDSLPDAFESNGGIDPTDPNGNNGPDGDPDEDELFTDEEFEAGTSPTNPDTDGDGYSDFVENGDGMFSDSRTTGTDPLDEDTDGDGLLDGMENPNDGILGGPIHRSDPNKADTDLDGVNDLMEITDGTDPQDPNSVNRPDLELLSIEPFENSDFESPDINSGESTQLPGWIQDGTRTIETTEFLNGRFTASAGEASQVSNLFFRGNQPRSFLAQDIRGTTNLNSEIHSLSGLELLGETLSLQLRIGIEAFTTDSFANAHGIVEIGLRNKASGSDEASWIQSETFYTGSQGEATAANVTAQIDRYLDLDETNQNGAALNYQRSYIIPEILPIVGLSVEFAIVVDRVNDADQGRALFDDIDITLGNGGSTISSLALSQVALTETGFSAMASNLDPTLTYELRRTTDLNTGFGETIGDAFSPNADGTFQVSDPAPPAGTRAFYRVQEVQ